LTAAQGTESGNTQLPSAGLNEAGRQH